MLTKADNALLLKIKNLWGDSWDEFAPSLGPLEGSQLEHVEATVHELCHAAFIGATILRGGCKPLPAIVELVVSDMPIFMQELHELRTLAAESVVIDYYDASIDLGTLSYMGQRNMKNWDKLSKWQVQKLIRLARRTKKVQRVARQIIGLLEG